MPFSAENFKFATEGCLDASKHSFIAIVFHLNKFKEEFIKMKNYDRNQVLIPEVNVLA
jgi:hypothetical protein